MINKIKNVKDRTIRDSFPDLEAAVNHIKDSKREDLETIRQAREAGKESDEYNRIKKGLMPCCAINFTYQDLIRGDTIIKPTGYLYMDVDDACEMDIDYKHVSAYWKSLSATGYTLVIKVYGLDKDYLKEAYSYVGKLLGVKYDKGAISRDRLTIISYDPDAYYNHSAEELVIPNFKDTKEEKNSTLNNSKGLELENNKCTHYSSIKDYSSTGLPSNGYKNEKYTSIIKYNNLDTCIRGLNIDYDENGCYDFGTNNKLPFAKAYIQKRGMLKGRRNTDFSIFLNQIISINPIVTEEEFLKYAHSINKTHVKPPLSNSEVIAIVNAKLKDRTKLKPFDNDDRRFIYSPDCPLSKIEQHSLRMKKINHERCEKSRLKIRLSMLSWDYQQLGKITIKKLVGVTEMDKKTIQKYYTPIKTDLGLL